MEATNPPTQSARMRLQTLALLIIPVVLLLGVIALFLFTSGAGLNIRPAAPIETMQFERTILQPGEIALHLRNTSPQDVTIAQVVINDAYWPFGITPNATIPRLGNAIVTLSYPWVEGKAYEVTFF